MYIYIKGHEKRGKWLPIEVDKVAQKLESKRFGFATVLAVTHGPKSGEDMPAEAMYQGPFYVDVDDDVITKAIKKAKKVLQALKGYGVGEDAVEIYATGKRGFHFLVPMRYFTADVPVKNLGFIYKLMMLQMGLADHVDTTVYSARKGRMWRIANRERADNGMFKVRITMQELEHMSAGAYEDLVAKPREMAAGTTFNGKLNALTGVYRLSVDKAAKSSVPPPIFVDEEMLESLGDELLPPCGNMMLMGDNINKEKGFNDLSLQMAKVVAAFAPTENRDLGLKFAENNAGDSYNTPAKRLDHFKRAYQSTSRAASYAWSCTSALSVLREEPCEGCPLINIRLAQMAEHNGEEFEAEDPDEELTEYVMPEKAAAPREAAAPRAAAPRETAAPSAPVPFEDARPVAKPRKGAPVLAGPYIPPEAQGEAQEAAPDELAPYDPSRVSRPPPREAPDAGTPKRRGAGRPTSGRSAPQRPVRTKDTPAPPPAAEEKPPYTEPPNEGEELHVSDLSTGLVDTPDGYMFPGQNAPRYISNFTLRIYRHYIEHIPNIGEDRRVAVQAHILIQGKSVGTAMIEEENWKSKSSLLSILHGLSNAGFYGKDEDVQKMKIALMGNVMTDTEQVRRVRAAGIHHAKIGDKDLFTYVEPGWSIDNFGNENKYQLSEKVNATPDLRTVALPEKGDAELVEGMRCLMKTNSPHKVTLMFSWYMACFLKAHIVSYDKQFPVLGVSGPKGAGKSKGNDLMASVHGLQYYSKHSTVNLANVTPFVVWNTLANTTTSPRILNEYNKSKLDVKNFKAIGELLKDVFEVGARQQGTIGANKAHGSSNTGAHVIEFPLLAPSVVLSEQSITMPALVERMIQVSLSPLDLNVEGVRENFGKAKDYLPAYRRFAKAAYMQALKTPIDTVKGWVESHRHYIPLDIGDRPQICFCIIMAGLDFFESVCREYDLNLLPEINKLRADFKDYLATKYHEIREAKNRTEVDAVLERFSVMASVRPDDKNGIVRLEPDTHYYREGDNLWMDGAMCHSVYMKYMRTSVFEPPVIDSYPTMKALLETEPYCINSAAISPDDWVEMTRPALQLSIKELEKRGHDCSPYLEDPSL